MCHKSDFDMEGKRREDDGAAFPEGITIDLYDLTCWTRKSRFVLFTILRALDKREYMMISSDNFCSFCIKHVL